MAAGRPVRCVYVDADVAAPSPALGIAGLVARVQPTPAPHRPAKESHAHCGTDRHAGEPEQHQHLRRSASALVLRALPYQPRALSLCRSWARRLPRVAQLTAIMSLNARRHVSDYVEQYRALVAGDEATAARLRSFYDEYGAVMDVPAEFYLESRSVSSCSITSPAESSPGAAVGWTLPSFGTPHCSPSRGLRTTCAPLGRPRRRTDCAPENGGGRRVPPGQEDGGPFGGFPGSPRENDIYPVIQGFIGANVSARSTATVS